MQGWNLVDLLSVGTGLASMVAVALLRPDKLSKRKAAAAFLNGFALGPLGLIVLSPGFALYEAVTGKALPDLMEVVLHDARLTLLVAALVAAVHIVEALLPGTRGRTDSLIKLAWAQRPKAVGGSGRTAKALAAPDPLVARMGTAQATAPVPAFRDGQVEPP